MRTNSFDRRFHESTDLGNPTTSSTERPAALAFVRQNIAQMTSQVDVTWQENL